MAAVQWEFRRHQVAIAGKVVNATTGAAVAGAEVNIDTGSVRVSTRTGADGHYHFLDLADGSYPVVASLPAAGSRYGSITVNATVSSDGSGNINMASVDMQLPATTISGEVSKPNNKPAVMAEVRLAGGSERVFTDSDGRYALVGVEIGHRTLTVTTQKFQPGVREVTLAIPGETVTVDVTLSPS